MDIEHNILTGAIEHALNDQDVMRKIKERDLHPGVRAREIRAKVIYPETKEDKLIIFVGFEFQRKSPNIHDGEDIRIKISYKSKIGYEIIEKKRVTFGDF